MPVPAQVVRAKARLMLTLVAQLTPVVAAIAQYRKTIDDFFASMAAGALGSATPDW